MNQQAIEAAAEKLTRLLYAEEDIPHLGGLRKEHIQIHATSIIEAARPHLEAELRAKIAEEIEMFRDSLTYNPRNHPRAKAHRAGLTDAARAVLGDTWPHPNPNATRSVEGKQ